MSRGWEIRILGAVLLCAVGSCAPEAGEGSAKTAPTVTPSSVKVRAVVPMTPPSFAPSQVEIAGGASLDGKWMSDVDSCDGCHTDVVAMWRTSAHAFAS